MYQEIIDDLTNLFLVQKIDKNTILKLLKIYKISHESFNKAIINKIRSMKIGSVLKVRTLLDSKFLKELVDQKTQNKMIVSNLDSNYDFKPVYKLHNFTTYNMSERILTVEELNLKCEQYFKFMNIQCRPNLETIEYLDKALKCYIKNIVSKCERVDVKGIKKSLGKHKKLLNICSIYDSH